MSSIGLDCQWLSNILYICFLATVIHITPVLQELNYVVVVYLDTELCKGDILSKVLEVTIKRIPLPHSIDIISISD